jgi:WD40 repeat protein
MNASSQPAAVPSLEKPYVGATPILDERVFFGRDEEAEELANRLISKRIVLLLSPSGAGKTSLIQAGLIPRLQERNFTILPTVRVSYTLPPEEGALPPYNRYLLSTLLSLEKGVEAEKHVELADLAGMSLAGYLEKRLPDFAAADGAQNGDRTLLVFDQFEEILSLNPSDAAGREAFFAALRPVLYNYHYWVLFAMREDYFAGLESSLNYFPDRLSARFRLEFLKRESALQAIVRPAEKFNTTFFPEAAQKLVEDLSRVRILEREGVREEFGLYVEPVQLQVVCSAVWDAPRADPNCITLQDVEKFGDVSNALARYYATKVMTVAAARQVNERSLRNWFEKGLITETGLRSQVLQGQERQFDLDSETVRLLVDAYLVRVETRRGAIWYELAHDRLIDPIRADNAAWFKEHLSLLQNRAEQWERSGRPDRDLLQGPELEEADLWAGQNDAVLTDVEREFLHDSCKRQDELQEQIRRELEDRQKDQDLAIAKARANLEEQAADRLRRNQRYLILTAIFAFLMAAAALYFFLQSHIDARQAQHALSSQYGVYSQETPNNQPRRKLFTALRALDVIQSANAGDNEPDTIPARQAIYDVLHVLGGVSYVPPQPEGILAGPAENQPAPLVPLSAAVTLQGDPVQPEDHWVAAAIDNQRILLWQTDRSGQRMPLILLTKNQQNLSNLQLSPDGRWLAVTRDVNPEGGQDEVLVWDLEPDRPPGEPRQIASPAALVSALVFSPDQRGLLIGHDDGSVDQVDLTSAVLTAQPLPLLGASEDVNALAISQDGKLLATGSQSGSVHLWELPGGQEQANFPAHAQSVTALAFDSLSRWLVTGSQDATAIAWQVHDSNDPELLLLPPVASATLNGHQGPLTDLAFRPDSSWVATASTDGMLRLWDIATGDPSSNSFELSGHQGSVNALSISPDGHWLTSAGEDGQARRWDLTLGNPSAVPLLLTGVSQPVQALASNPQGGWLFAAVDAGAQPMEILGWDLSNHSDPASVAPILRAESLISPTLPLAMPASGSWLALGGQDGLTHIIDPATDNLLATLPGHQVPVQALAASPDGRWLATGGADGGVGLWDSQGWQEVRQASPGGAPVDALVFHPNGRWLFSGDQNGRLLLWNLDDPQAHPVPFSTSTLDLASISVNESPEVNKIGGLAISPDGRWLAVAVNGRSQSDTEGGQAKGAIYLVDLQAYQANTVGRSWRGLLASLQDLWQGRQREGPVPQDMWLRDEPPMQQIRALAFSPDGRWLAAADGSEGSALDGLLRLWDMSDPGSNVLRLKSHSGVVNSLAFTQGGNYLATGAPDGSVDLWPLKIERLVATACSLAGERPGAAEYAQIFEGEPWQRLCNETLTEQPFRR